MQPFHQGFRGLRGIQPFAGSENPDVIHHVGVVRQVIKAATEVYKLYRMI